MREPPRTFLATLISARRMTVEETIHQFDATARSMDERVSVSVKQMRRWMGGELTTLPRPAACRVAERLFGHSMEVLLGPPAGSLPGSCVAVTTRPAGGSPATSDPANDVRCVDAAAEESALFAQWAEVSNVGASTIEQLQADLRHQAEAYLHQAPLPVFLGIKRVRDRAFGLLEGHQSPTQTRDLYAVAGYACAVLSWIAGDLGQPTAADTLGRTGWLCADLADTPELRAWVLATRSKGAFWAGRYRAAIDFARRGQAYAPPTSVAVLLAAQEADAWAELGATEDARAAILVVPDHRARVTEADVVGGLLSCGPSREANYVASVHVRLGDAATALDAADRALAGYASRDQRSYGTEAQIHLTRTRAYLLREEPEGALAAAAPVLDLPADQRLAPVADRVRQLNRSLARSRCGESTAGRELRDRVAEFCAHDAVKALPA